MSRKYCCDVCDREFYSSLDLCRVGVYPNIDGDSGRYFEACPPCREKIFKNVKRWMAMVKIEVNDKGGG